MIDDKLIQERKPVWVAISKFYLDTDFDTDELIQIIQIFRDSPYSLDEIKLIDRFEVRPVVGSNMYSIAGVWDGFDEEWLVERASKFITSNKKGNFWSNFFYKESHYWGRIDFIIKRYLT